MTISIEAEDDIQDSLQASWASCRKIVTVGGEATTKGWELGFHSHAKAQILFVVSGVVTCEVEAGIWLVPPGSALFIAGGMAHRLAIAGEVKSYVTLIQHDATQGITSRCCALTVSPLFRELILRSADFSMDGEETSTEAHVSALLLSEVAAAETNELHLPMPSDARLRAIFADIMADPGHRSTIAFWARQSGLSQRSLERLITTETGMSFGRWRQQLNIMLALQWMAAGRTVQQVAFDLGYESIGSFVTMFRKVLGSTPGRYVSERSKRR